MAGSPVVVRAETATFSGKRQTRSDQPGWRRGASRLPQLKSGHALTGVYLKSTENRPYNHSWWCDPETIVALARQETT